MKRISIVFLLLMITFSISAQSLDRQIRNLAEEITRGYMEGIEDLLIKPRIGIGEFSEESEGAEKNSVGSLASALLTDEFSRSTVFSVIERKDLEAIMEEYSLSLSGLTSEETAPELGELQGVELLLLGSVSEAGETYIITARLVEVETGKIVVSSGIKVGREEIEQQSQLYMASTFQSPYGITLSPNGSVLLELGGNKNLFFLSSVDAGYRVTKWLELSMGYANIRANELNGLDAKWISVPTDEAVPTYSDVARYFRFYADGIKLAATLTASPTARLSLGGQLAAVVYGNARLEQDITDFPIWQLIDQAVVLGDERVIVDGYTHSFYATYHASFSADYLISQRLSLFGRVGGFYMPEFIPTWFESAGIVRDFKDASGNADIDGSGIFPQYMNFNFSRSSTGERIGFSAMGVSIQLGIAVNF